MKNYSPVREKERRGGGERRHVSGDSFQQNRLIISYINGLN